MHAVTADINQTNEGMLEVADCCHSFELTSTMNGDNFKVGTFFNSGI